MIINQEQTELLLNSLHEIKKSKKIERIKIGCEVLSILCLKNPDHIRLAATILSLHRPNYFNNEFFNKTETEFQQNESPIFWIIYGDHDWDVNEKGEQLRQFEISGPFLSVTLLTKSIIDTQNIGQNYTSLAILSYSYPEIPFSIN